MSSRQLSILSALVAVLAVIVALDRPAPPRPAGTSQRVLPGLDADAVRSLALVAPGREPVRLSRVGEGSGLVVTHPRATPVDAAAARDLLGALEYLSWRRRLPAGDLAERGLDPAHARRVELVLADGSEHTLAFGKSVPGIGRTYLLVDGQHRYLVDDHAAAALDRGLDELRARTPLPERVDLAGAELHIGGLVVRGEPPCVVLDGGCARADRALVARLLARLARFSLVLFRDDLVVEEKLVVVVAGARVVVGGACPGREDLVAADTPLGRGCVDAGLVSELAGLKSLELVDRHVVELPLAELRTITLAQGGRRLTLVREGRDWQDASASPRRALPDDALSDWARDVTSFAAIDLRAITPAKTPPPGAQVVELARDDAPAERLWVVPYVKDRVLVVRPDDPIGLLVHADVARLLAPEPTLFASRRVLDFEPSALSAVTIERPGQPRERAVRGATLDDWSLVEPLALPVDADALAALRDAAAHLTATRVLPPSTLSKPTRLTLTVDPPPGGTTPASHVLDIVDSPECLARRDDLLYALDAELCAALTGFLASHELWPVGEPVAAGGFEKHGPSWYGPGGARLSQAQVDTLLADLAALAAPAAVAGYGAPTGKPLVLRFADGREVQLVWGAGEYGLAGRPVRYRIPAITTRL